MRWANLLPSALVMGGTDGTVTDFRCASRRLNFRPMEPLRVRTAALPAMAARWGTSAGELTDTAAPSGLASSAQPSAAAVQAAHAGIAIFTVNLARRVDMLADATSHYVAYNSSSGAELAALTDSSTVG